MEKTPFLSTQPSIEDCWRGVILYGRNTASYKFALASALLEISPEAGQLLKLEDLAPAFALHICRHLEASPKQITTQDGQFIKACLQFNLDQDLNKLVATTVSAGFNNVIDAFHVVGATPVAHSFFIDERKANRGIRITDSFSQLLSGFQAGNFIHEVESRWRLVETAWNLGVASNLLNVQYDSTEGELFTVDKLHRRKAVTSSRNALNGYQKGVCFYCFSELLLQGGSANVDVDHFFPHRLKAALHPINLDGIWNLVLSCTSCNRGAKGKFDRIPSLRLLHRLHTRNEYFISSHHPLRETLLNQTGVTEAARISFLDAIYRKVQLNPALAWEAEELSSPLF